ncbi:MAG: hypothetical protein R6V22_07950 [Rhodohalobacter sp.]
MIDELTNSCKFSAQMVFDNERADLLSREEQIRNPYFHDIMPGFGEVNNRFMREIDGVWVGSKDS